MPEIRVSLTKTNKSGKAKQYNGWQCEYHLLYTLDHLHLGAQTTRAVLDCVMPRLPEYPDATESGIRQDTLRCGMARYRLSPKGTGLPGETERIPLPLMRSIYRCNRSQPKPTQTVVFVYACVCVRVLCVRVCVCVCVCVFCLCMCGCGRLGT